MSRCKCPERDQDSEETKDVDDQYYAFDQWQFLSKEGVGKDCDCCYRDDYESRVPWLSNVVRIVECDDALDLGGNEVAAAADVDLPSEDAEPAGDVGEKLLRARWREL